jgi:hypothetical protein
MGSSLSDTTLASHMADMSERGRRASEYSASPQASDVITAAGLDGVKVEVPVADPLITIALDTTPSDKGIPLVFKAQTHGIIGKGAPLGPILWGEPDTLGGVLFEPHDHATDPTMPRPNPYAMPAPPEGVPVISEESRAEMNSGKGTKDDRGKLDLVLLPFESLEMLALADSVVRGFGWHPRFDRLPMKSLCEVVKVLEFGAKKYSRDNWRNGMKWSRVTSAAKRHILLGWLTGEDFDPETKINHLAHTLCCLMFIIWYEKNEAMKENDDRFEKVIKHAAEKAPNLRHDLASATDVSWRWLANYILTQIMLWENRDEVDRHVKMSRLNLAAFATMWLLEHSLNPDMKKNDDRFAKNQ